MNLRQGAILLVMFISYLLMGGAIFMVLEDEAVLQEDNPTYDALTLFRDALLSNESRDVVGVEAMTWTAHVNYVFENLTRNEEVKVNVTINKWSFYDATFFCLTVITTIGYGNKTPSNDRSRGFCIVYALLGIPMTGIWMAGVGDFFSKKLLRAHEKTKSLRSGSPRLALTINTVTYLIPGFIIFLILPAAIFMALEEWTFLDSLYYSVVTLTTIGFGDFVAGQGDDEYKWMYKVLLMVWIIFGLGYLSMILNFIARAMKSKHVKKIERSLTKNLKQTQEAFAKELEFIVKSLNVYVNKIKAKQDQAATLERTNSCPSLDGSKSQRNSFMEPTRGHAETSANFIFDLAMAIACGELERDNGQTITAPNADEQVNSNVAHLLTMALLPQLCGVSSNGAAPPPPPQTQQPPPEKPRNFLDFFKKKDNDVCKVGKMTKSNSVVGNLMFPFGGAVPNPAASNGQPRRQSELVTSRSSVDTAELFKNGLLKQWENLSKEIAALNATDDVARPADPTPRRRASADHGIRFHAAPDIQQQLQQHVNRRQSCISPLQAIEETDTRRHSTKTSIKEIP